MGLDGFCCFFVVHVSSGVISGYQWNQKDVVSVSEATKTNDVCLYQGLYYAYAIPHRNMSLVIS